jgi:RNA polymerase sigma-70 factor (ECF subfamily)
MRAPAAPAEPLSEPSRAQVPTIAEVYERHAALIWRIVRRQGIPDAAAEDVMHEVFLVVQRRLHEFDGRAALSTWLFHLARGVVSNYKRGRARERARLEVVAPPTSSMPDPEHAALRREAAGFVREFLRGLDVDKREVFELVEIDGIAVPEVAELLGLNLNTAYSRLRLARQAFARALETLRAQEAR